MNPRPRITPISLVRPPAADSGPLIGAHMSIAGGLDKAIERALAVRARVLQIFTRNTNQWKARRLTPSEIQAFRKRWGESGLHTVVAHDCYLINLASPVETLRQRSVETLAEELLRCEALGIPFLVTHPGAHMGRGSRKDARERRGPWTRRGPSPERLP